MSSRAIPFLFLLFFYVSCSFPIIEKHDVEEDLSSLVHISDNDLESIDGDMQLALTLEDAKIRGVSEKDYLFLANQIKEFNDYTERMIQDTLDRSDGFVVRLLEVTSGILFYESNSQEPATEFYSVLPQGDYLLSYQFSSSSFVSHDLGVYWSGNIEHHIYEYGMNAVGNSNEDNRGYSFGLSYQCDAYYSGVCLWRLFLKIRIPIS